MREKKSKAKRKMGRPKGTKTQGKNHTIPKRQLKRFLQVIANSPKHDLMFSLTLFFGLRVAEASRIKLSDIKPSTKEITIQGVKDGRIRTYSIPAPLWKKYQTWMEERERDKKSISNPYLFPHRLKRNQPMTREGFQYDFKAFCKKAGIEGHSIHDLRHTCAMIRVEQGVNPIDLRNWLRQKSISSTEKYFEEYNSKADEKKAQKDFKDLL